MNTLNITFTPAGAEKFARWIANVAAASVNADAVSSELRDTLLDQYDAGDDLVYELGRSFTASGLPELIKFDRADFDATNANDSNITYRLRFKTVTNPDFGGFKFYVEEGRLFDADDYADAYKLNRCDIDAQDIHSAQDAAGRLIAGEWLEVTHEASDE